MVDTGAQAVHEGDEVTADELWRAVAAHARLEDHFALRYVFAGSAFLPDEERTPEWLERITPAWDRRSWAYAALQPDARFSPVPRDDKGRLRGQCSVLWARLDSGPQYDKALPLGPSIVVREGTSVRRTALWLLDKPIALGFTEKACLRLSYRLGTKRSTADPATAPYVPFPGTVLAWGREGRPLRAELERFDPRPRSAREVVGRLPDPPPRSTEWRDKK